MRIKIPYTLKFLFPVIGWGLLCSAFSYVLILTIASFDQGNSRQVFILTSPIYFFILSFISILRYGGIGFLSGNDIPLINKNVVNNGINPNIPVDEVKRTFSSLLFLCGSTFMNVVASGLLVMFLVILTAFISSASWLDILVITVGGAIATFFFSAFSTFFCQMMVFNIVKDCRRILIER
ncbi:MAG: hypothetical protein PHD31_01015, partial [Candidatus Pacebacteria bacterium]|nr:hypothetical protein [Candidatus Paceibacterota bacterium]